MTQADVEAAIIEAVREVQSLSGRTGAVDVNTRPFDDLAGFDSLNAVEAVCLAASKLKRDIKGEIDFFFPEKGRHVTISMVASRIVKSLEVGK